MTLPRFQYRNNHDIFSLFFRPPSRELLSFASEDAPQSSDHSRTLWHIQLRSASMSNANSIAYPPSKMHSWNQRYYHANHSFSLRGSLLLSARSFQDKRKRIDDAKYDPSYFGKRDTILDWPIRIPQPKRLDPPRIHNLCTGTKSVRGARKTALHRCRVEKSMRRPSTKKPFRLWSIV